MKPSPKTPLESWIACSTRMPGNGQYILAFGPKLGQKISGPTMDICHWFDGELFDEGGTEFCHHKFTHWIPLPKSPIGHAPLNLRKSPLDDELPY